MVRVLGTGMNTIQLELLSSYEVGLEIATKHGIGANKENFNSSDKRSIIISEEDLKQAQEFKKRCTGGK